MTDLEMTKLCAEAMGLKIVYPDDQTLPICIESYRGAGIYSPLHDDASAMAMVKKFKLNIGQLKSACKVFTPMWARGQFYESEAPDLNRAIVECVAKMQVKAMTTNSVRQANQAFDAIEAHLPEEKS